MAESSRADRLQLLLSAIVDIRTSVESMLRSVEDAESCIETFHHRGDSDALGAISEHLSRITIESGVLLESIAAAREPLSALLNAPRA